MPGSQRLISQVVLETLPVHLGRYVRARLRNERPGHEQPLSAGDGEALGQLDLNDLSSQIYVLTGRGRDGRPILKADPGLCSRLTDIRVVRDRLVRGSRFEPSEVPLVLSEVAEVLRLIGAAQAAAEVTARLTAGAGPAPRSPEPAGNPVQPDDDAVESIKGAAAETAASPAAPPTSAPAPAAASALDAVELELDVPPIISYAHAVAGLVLPLRLRLSIAAPRPSGDPVDGEGEVGEEVHPQRTRPVPALSPSSGSWCLTDVGVTAVVESDGEALTRPVVLGFARLSPDGAKASAALEPDRSALLQIETQTTSSLRLTLRCGDESREMLVEGPTVLSPRQWILSGRYSDDAATLAAFVQPQQPVLAALSRSAATILGRRTGSSSLEGYQGSPERIPQIVEALCDAIHDDDIAYAVPPTSWGEHGQRVRTAEDVLEGRLGTCLDTTILMASVLEYLSIEPLIVVLPGHALVGYWRAEQHISEDLAMPGRDLVNQIDRGEIGLIETTMLTERRRSSLAQMHSAARQRIGADASAVDVIIPVREARNRGIIPMPLRRRSEDGDVTEIEYVAAPRPSVLIVPDEAPARARRRPARRKAPDRVEEWKARLLDLSLRNRLINCSDSAIRSHKIVELAVPEAVIGDFEDLVNADRVITLRQAGERAALVRSAGGLFRDELDPPQLAPRLGDHREVEVDLSEDVYDTTLRRLRSTARTLAEETGANNLYLALGSLVWESKGRRVRSPLVLIPVDLERRSARSPFRLRIDPSGSTVPNYSLIERLRADLGLDLTELSEPEEDGAGIDLKGLFDVVRRVLAENRLPFHVEATTYLGIFQFGTFRLWKDLEESWEPIARNPLVNHLINSPNAEFHDPAANTPVPGLEDLVPRLPVPADASQTEVVARALAGRTLVVEGPPGTGKSQTITNVIVSAVAQGRRVLFVAEKRAALDVVSRRLRQASIGDLVLDLHSRRQAPDAVRRKILRAMDMEARPDRISLTAKSGVADSYRRRLSGYWEALHRRSPAGLSYYDAHTSELAYGRGRTALAIEPMVLARLLPDDVASLRNSVPRLMECLQDYGDVLGPEPFPLSNPVPDAALGDILGRVEALMGVMEQDDGKLLAAVRTLPDSYWDKAAAALEDPSLNTARLNMVAQPDWQRAARWLMGELTAELSAAHPALRYYLPSVLNEDLQSVRSSLVDAKNSFFGKTRKSERALGALAAHRTAVPMPQNGAELLAVVDELIRLATRRDALSRCRTSLLPEEAAWSGQWTPFDRSACQGAIGALDRLLGMSDLGTPPGWRAGPAQETVASLLAAPDRRAAAAWLRGYAAAFRALAGDSRALEASPAVLDSLHSLGSAPARERRLRGCNVFLTAGAEFRRVGLEGCLDQLLRGQVDANELPSALDLGLVHASLELQGARGAFSSFSSDHQYGYVRSYARTLDEIRSLLPPVLVSDALAARARIAPVERVRMAALRRALERKRGKRRVRDLVGEFGDLITALTPCVLMSPDSVARFFPADRQDFDLVVFDEASQITVAAAVGAMGRGRSVVVCGDSRQMPPTSFAELSRDEDPDDAPLDEESILSECVAAHVPRLWLSWHYRSQVEGLIAFSNKSYYQGRLSSFPSPVTAERDPGPTGFGISLRRVSGQFIRSVPRGQSRRFFRTNSAEAEAIVDEIRRRFAQAGGSAPSLGVITFNTQQRDLIETRLRDLDDRKITASLDADEGIFVKNLENVQGDERDTILFSVAFSANERGDIPLNFGPLNRQGGERRLNVAITRARRQVIVFCSFAPAQLQAERSESRGLQDLKRYLVLAEQGTRTLVGKTFGAGVPDRHREDVAQALREAGMTVATDVGLSDFRIDLVLARAEEPHVPLVAVLLDGLGWSERSTVYDRDVLPVRVLSQMLDWPCVERLWLPQWLQDRDGVIAHLCQVVDKAAKKVAGRRRSEEIAPDKDVEGPKAENSSPAAGGDDGAVEESRGGDIAALRPAMAAPLQSAPPARGAANPDTTSPGAISPGTTSPGTGGSRRTGPACSPDPDVRTGRDLTAVTDFVPASPTPRGPREVLDAASTDRESVELLHAAAREICEAEFPIEQRRFLSLVCAAFGLRRMTASREKKVRALLRGSGCSVDDYGFVWPEGADQSLLTGYRRDAFDYLSLKEIHPHELENYIRSVLLRTPPDADEETVLRAVFDGLGVRAHRLTAPVRQTLEGAILRVRRRQTAG